MLVCYVIYIYIYIYIYHVNTITNTKHICYGYCILLDWAWHQAEDSAAAWKEKGYCILVA